MVDLSFQNLAAFKKCWYFDIAGKKTVLETIAYDQERVVKAFHNISNRE